jgi:hypothetical protein
MSDSRRSETSHLALAFSERRELARLYLQREMKARGLDERNGWKIAETVRPVPGGTELVLKPIHLRDEAPSELECVLTVHEADGSSEVEAINWRAPSSPRQA